MEYGCSPEYIADMARAWKVSVPEAESHLKHVCAHRYYAQAVMFPGAVKGQDGILLASSTAESTRISHQNEQAHAEGKGIAAPY